jgi:hypothetical protein
MGLNFCIEMEGMESPAEERYGRRQEGMPGHAQPGQPKDQRQYREQSANEQDALIRGGAPPIFAITNMLRFPPR